MSWCESDDVSGTTAKSTEDAFVFKVESRTRLKTSSSYPKKLLTHCSKLSKKRPQTIEDIQLYRQNVLLEKTMSLQNFLGTGTAYTSGDSGKTLD